MICFRIDHTKSSFSLLWQIALAPYLTPAHGGQVTVHIPPLLEREIKGYSDLARGGVNHYDLPIAKNIVVTTPVEIAEYGDLVGPILRPALREGKVIYERDE